jgi:AAA15 family ATPase/GTPase
MLLRFKVSNFLSILEEQELCLFPSRVRGFKEHIYKTKASSLPEVLKSALIYGANSSGKSNMVRAISYAKNMVIAQQNLAWDVPVFKLSEKPSDESRFSFEILLENKCYQFGYTVKNGIISEEWLSAGTKYSENKLYSRKTEGEKVNITFQMKFKNKASEDFHKTICKGTRTNQLFLNFINEKNPGEIENIFRKLYVWFRNKLTVIFPQSKIQGIEIHLFENRDLWAFYNKCLTFLDTGIDKLDFDEFPFEDPKFQIPDVIKEDIRQKIQDERTIYTVSSRNNDTYYVARTEGKLKVKKIKAAHAIKGQGNYIQFDFSAESDGTNRIMDLIPMLYLLEQGNTVIIDEIDRSFHSLISMKFFELFFEKTEGVASQLIATTHDLTLLDLKKFRRDEVWFIRKDIKNQSVLYSLEEFKPRFDKQLRSAYLDGRFGAVPLLSDIMETADAI